MKKISKILFYFFLLFAFTNASFSNSVIDSLKLELKNLPPDTNYVNTLLNIVSEYYSINTDSAIKYAEKTIKFSKKLKFNNGLSDGYGWLGYLFNINGKIQDAILNYNKRLTINIKQNDYKALAITYNNLGFIYENQGIINKAIEFYNKSLSIKEKHNLKSGIANSYNNIAYLYHKQKNYNKALEYYNKALTISETLNNKILKARILNNIGNLYESKNQTDTAIKFYNKSLNLEKINKNNKGIATEYNNLGFIYKQKQQYKKALDFFEKSLEIRKKLNDKKGIAISLNNIGNLYFETNKLKQAKIYGQKAFKISKQLGFPDNIRSTALLLKNICVTEGHLDSAYIFYDLYIQMRDSLYNIQNQNATIAQEFRYKYQKKALTDSINNAKKQEIKDLKIKEQKLQLEKEKNFTYSLLLGLVLLIIIIAILIRGFIIKQKTAKILKAQQTEIIEKNKILTDSIVYAKKIQTAVLPDKNVLEVYFKNYFIFFKPKDIVSGDFYWISENNQNTVISVADSTGHGVPGAFMSMLGISFLNEIVLKQGILKANKILSELRNQIIFSLKQKGDFGEQKDGMDIALFILNKTQTTDNKYMCQFSGANNPIYIITDKEIKINNKNKLKITKIENCKSTLYEIIPDKMPISIYDKMNNFTNIELLLNKDDTVYLFTDGFADQFGGKSPNGKKFKYKQFKELLLKNSNLTLNEQHNKIEEAFYNWKGNHEQIDDILILGIKI